MANLEEQRGTLDHEAPKDTYGAPMFSEVSWRIGFLAAGVIAVIASTLIFGPPLYRAAKAQRALGLARECEKFLATDDMHGAGNRIKAALALAPMEPPVLRAAARFCSKYYIRQGLSYWEMLAATPAMNREDRIGYAEFALNLQRSDLAVKQIERIMRDNEKDSEGMRLTVRFLALSGKVNDAILMARNWVDAQPGDDLAAFTLATMLMYRPDPVERADGRRLLWTLALGNGPQSRTAAQILIPNTELSRGENEALIAALLNRKSKRIEDRLAAFSIRIKLDPAQKPGQIRLAHAELTPSTQDNDLSQVADWLIDQDAIPAALDLLPVEKVRDSAVLLATRLRALSLAGRWTEVGEFIEREQKAKVIDPFLRHCYAAAMDLSLHKDDPLLPDRIMGHFGNAIAACQNRVAPLRFTAAYAEALGQHRAAIAAHQALLEFPPLLIPSAKAILRLVDFIDDIRIQHSTLQRLVDFIPNDRGYQRQYHYVSLLLRTDLNRAHEYFKNELALNPADESLKVALAFAELRLGRSAEALQWIDTAKIDWAKSNPRWQAIHIAVLGANEDRVGAKQMARKIDQTRLRAEERELIAPWL